MELFVTKKNSWLLYLFVLLALLFFFLLKKGNNISHVEQDLFSSANLNYPELPQEYIKQINEFSLFGKDSVYSAKFYETPLERQLVLINKNPSFREFRNQIIVYVYPKDIESFKKASNFNEKKKILDYSTTYYPVMYQYNNDNYSVLKINLPFINTQKIRILQHGVYEKYFKNTFDDILVNKPKEIPHTVDDLFLPVFNKLLQENKIFSLSLSPNDSISPEEYSHKNNKMLIEVHDKIKFWKRLSSKDKSYKKYMHIIGNDESKITHALDAYIESKLNFSEVFDFDKLVRFYALLNLFSDNSSKKVCLIYNEATRKIEPIYSGENNLGTLNTYVKDEGIDDVVFFKKYTEASNRILSLDMDDYLKKDMGLPDRIRYLHQKNPALIFKSDILFHNKLVIKKALNPAVAAKIALLKITADSLSFTVDNLSVFPIQVMGLHFKKKKLITRDFNHKVIFSETHDTIKIKLPRSFENLFVNKKKKTTGFVFDKNIFDLRVSYTVLGLEKEFFIEIIPYQAYEDYELSKDLFRQKHSISEYDFLNVNELDKTIVFDKKTSINRSVILPEDYTLVANPGTEINILNGGKIITHSPIRFIGTKQLPIRIYSEDNLGQGLVVLAEAKESTLTHVIFDGLTNPSHGRWSTTSAITFYESPVVLNYCTIKNNTCEDALNVVRTHFTMTNCGFFNTQSDAFDGDFVSGEISNSVFTNLGNDAIDVSGSIISISDVKINKAGDKGLSAGEDSQMHVSNTIISDCGIAVAGKDLSTVILDSIVINKTPLGFTAYQKKPEFGPSTIKATSLSMNGVETEYLIEKASTLIVDTDTIKTKQDDVKSKMYGVEFGVSSKKTRKKK